MTKTFGIYIGAYPGDFWMAKGCVASLRRQHPDVPICLLWDADRLPSRRFLEHYRIICLRPGDIKDPQLQMISRGQGGLKMAIFWEGPFEQFCYLDGDTILTQPFLKDDLKFHKGRAFTANGPGQDTEQDVNKWFFKTNDINRFLPDFDWRGFPYFNSGIYFGSRNCISKSRYLSLRKWQKEEPDCFFVGDQGILNILVAYEVQQKNLAMESRPLQAMVTSSTPVEGFDERIPLIHWCGGEKPSIRSSLFHAGLMTDARAECLHALLIPRVRSDWLVHQLLKLEDYIFTSRPKPEGWHYPLRWRIHRAFLKCKPLYL